MTDGGQGSADRHNQKGRSLQTVVRRETPHDGSVQAGRRDSLQDECFKSFKTHGFSKCRLDRLCVA